MQALVFGTGIVLFIGLVMVHEWGHLIAARRNGVDVEEYGLFFPPRLWSRKLKSGMRLSFNAIPLGGFVKLKGENDSDERPHSLGSASLGSKAKIMMAGVTMNLLVGIFILMVLAWIGMPKLITKDNPYINEDQFTVASDTKITHKEVLAHYVIPGSPAQHIGLSGYDSLVSLSNGQKTYNIDSVETLQTATKSFAGQNVTLIYKRNGQAFQKQVKLLSKKAVSDSQKTNNPQGYLGVEDPSLVQLQRSTWSAPIVAIGLTGQIFKLTFLGLGHALGGLGSAIAGLVTHNQAARQNGQTTASSQVGGPVAIGYALWGAGNLGFNVMLFLIALISLTLALMNALPIPALDGGRLAMMLVSRGIFKRPLTKSAEERIVGASFMALMALVVLITFVDIKRFF